MRTSDVNPASIRRPLLRWFDRNQRSMPWRGSKDPYRVWVSEVMLQQTRVTAVVPYYERFMKRFPTVGALARARNILPYWSGLGYYSRARNMHRAAREIVAEFGGRFPDDLDAALSLPGVGDYTARAVLSIAYDRKFAVVDGNVARVLMRLHALANTPPSDRTGLQPLADHLLSSRRPGDFNQAMMELGATVCLPRRPRCADCPLASACRARRAGLADRIPARTASKQRPVVALDVFVPRRDGKVLLVREPSGYFSGLWHFPYRVRNGKRNGRRPMISFTHGTTMRDLEMNVFPATSAALRRLESMARLKGRWVRVERPPRIAIGAATRRILDELRNTTPQSRRPKSR